ncbi:geranylgeranylglyceryl/heptaprenylglyceryl phosphate synthase [Carboxylicivirga linearis]|uniref:Geranylgeranylglyceryl phosphate synthase n=1 Tax=Carboxylicivirga linearis TaxID=1628157 RepID=A0ABS5JQK8_9BACT|nr:geranylgeranylglyceryl/heptaprenylglyceryl phosphate synthase [Carboxylicivirga linearis]MBS2097088.1 geranylgeranylglyceryl/heptaprenylglyceryl phosphate synthase [Carboxylicivirga linearis]
MIYKQISENHKQNIKQLALLIDPDKFSDEQMRSLSEILERVTPDLLLVGGSLVSTDTFTFIEQLKKHINLPVVLYPGSSTQYASNVDAILFLSLLSGRNSEYLISHHVASAPLIKANNTEVISTGYLLIDGGCTTSVQYISQTQPIPANKNDIAIATALAGQFLGMKLIYMDAGSGAIQPIPANMISAVKHQLDIPLMIGGGLNTAAKVKDACSAGADIIVIGNAFEKDLSLIEEFSDIVRSFNQ